MSIINKLSVADIMDINKLKLAYSDESIRRYEFSDKIHFVDALTKSDIDDVGYSNFNIKYAYIESTNGTNLIWITLECTTVDNISIEMYENFTRIGRFDDKWMTKVYNEIDSVFKDITALIRLTRRSYVRGRAIMRWIAARDFYTVLDDAEIDESNMPYILHSLGVDNTKGGE